MPTLPAPRRVLATLCAAAAAVSASLVLAPPAQAQIQCSDVHVVFARGSGEFPGLGSAGTPLVAQIRQALPGRTVSSYAVNYAAALNQSSAGAGATDMSNHVVAAAAACPGQGFVVGGYSQGASVTTIALGVPTTLGRGTAIPAALSDRIVAVVAFGNPLGLSRRTLAGASPTYASRVIEFCNVGDPVCAGAGTGLGSGHLSYPRDGSTARAAAFVAQRVGARAAQLA